MRFNEPDHSRQLQAALNDPLLLFVRSNVVPLDQFIRPTKNFFALGIDLISSVMLVLIVGIVELERRLIVEDRIVQTVDDRRLILVGVTVPEVIFGGVAMLEQILEMRELSMPGTGSACTVKVTSQSHRKGSTPSVHFFYAVKQIFASIFHDIHDAPNFFVGAALRREDLALRNDRRRNRSRRNRRLSLSPLTSQSH